MKIQKEKQAAKVVEKETKKQDATKAKPVEAKAETKPVEQKDAEVPAPKLERPKMPEGFCMTEQEWDKDGVAYEAYANGCVQCEKEAPKVFKVCKARAEFLEQTKRLGKTAKARKSANKAARVKKDGKTFQSIIIDGYLKASMKLEDMYKALATSDFGGDTESGRKAAEVRITSHLKAIETGKYCRTAEIKPFTAYLKAKSAAKAPAEKAARK